MADTELTQEQSSAPRPLGVYLRRQLVAILALSTALAASVGCGESSASLFGGDRGEQKAESGLPIERVRLDGRTFRLELAADSDSRTKGLGEREEIAKDGGMLFVFPDARPRTFIMRDCLVPIDIIFLDATSRIVAMHQMEVEPPRKEGESDREYEDRLHPYRSRWPTQFVIEIRGGLLDELKLEPGQRIDLDTDRLRELAR